MWIYGEFIFIVIDVTLSILFEKASLPISCHWSLSIPPENIRKPEAFWCFRGGGGGGGGVSKEISGMKWVNAILFIVHGPDLSVLAINPGVFEKEML